MTFISGISEYPTYILGIYSDCVTFKSGVRIKGNTFENLNDLQVSDLGFGVARRRISRLIVDKRVEPIIDNGELVYKKMITGIQPKESFITVHTEIILAESPEVLKFLEDYHDKIYSSLGLRFVW